MSMTLLLFSRFSCVWSYGIGPSPSIRGGHRDTCASRRNMASTGRHFYANHRLSYGQPADRACASAQNGQRRSFTRPGVYAREMWSPPRRWQVPVYRKDPAGPGHGSMCATTAGVQLFVATICTIGCKPLHVGLRTTSWVSARTT